MEKQDVGSKFMAIIARIGHSEAAYNLPFAMSKIDSLDVVELMMTCEKEFNISISDLEMSECSTPNQLIELVKAKVG